MCVFVGESECECESECESESESERTLIRAQTPHKHNKTCL